MKDGELRSALETTGLTQYQAAAYLALLDLGAAPAADIAEKSGVPGPRIYDVLRDLEKEGYVELYKQGQLHARVHDPSAVVETFERNVNQFKQAKQTVEDRWQQPDLENYAVSIAKRRETAFERASTALENAENQIKIAVDGSQIDRFRDDLEVAFSNDVTIKLCFWTDVSSTEDVETDRFEGIASEVRHRELPAPFVAIVDRSTVCFAPNQQSTNEYGVIVHDPGHAYVFNVFFQSSLWAQWPTIYRAPGDGQSRQYVDIRECVRDVDELLAADATIHARIVGTRVDTGEPIEIEGEIMATGSGDTAKPSEESPYPSLNGIASLTIATDGGTYTAGGWGAMLEDIEATRVTLTKVESPHDEND